MFNFAKNVVEAVGQELVNNLVNRMGSVNFTQFALFDTVETDKLAIRKFFVLEFPKELFNVSVNVLHKLCPLIADASRPLTLLLVTQKVINDEIEPFSGEKLFLYKPYFFHNLS